MNNLNNITNPFIYYCQKVIPLAFDESMSYYEQLCNLTYYIKNTLTSAINQNIDAINELQNLYVQLKEYVDHYFDNLDIQEEVNNKLDEMAESGELESIIAQYLTLATTYSFDSVEDMKNATNLTDGAFARTSGFYTYNDGGGANYRIRNLTIDDTIDEKTIIAIDGTLIAELLNQNQMNVKQFGAKGDGETDDTASIQKAFDFCKNIIIKDGTYMIDAETSILPKSNSYIKLVNATLKAITNDLDTYKMIYIHGENNIVIEGGTIQGERTTHTGATGEWGHCIHISSWSENITIKNVILKDAWGDGLYINRGTNINTQNCLFDNNRRQGISIISVKGYHSLNDKIINTNGTAPESAIDIEPNATTDKINDVVLENLYTENNNGIGVDIYLASLDGTSDPVSIKVINHHDKGSKTGERVSHKGTLRNNIILENSLLENNNTGISLRDCWDNEIDKVQIIRPKIINCNYDNNSDAPAYITGISCYTTNGETSEKLGGVIIIEPFITSILTSSRRGIAFYDTTNTNKCNNVDIINPLNHQSNLNITYYGDNITFTDLYNKYTYSTNSNKEIIPSQLYSKVSNINFQSSRTITLNEELPIGYEITIMTEKISYRPKIQFGANDYCRYFNTTQGNLLTMDTMNSLITLRKRDAHEWYVERIIGTISVSE